MIDWRYLLRYFYLNMSPNLDGVDLTPYLFETDAEGSTLFFFALWYRSWISQEKLKDKTLSLAAQTKYVRIYHMLNVILNKLDALGANYFMPNDKGYTPYDILLVSRDIEPEWLNEFIRKHAAQENEQQPISEDYFRWVSEMVVTSPDKFVSDLKKQTKPGAAPLMDKFTRPLCKMPGEEKPLTCIDFLTRAKRYDLILRLIRASKVQYNKNLHWYSFFDAEHIYEFNYVKIDDELLWRIINNVDQSCLRGFRGLTQAQQQIVYRAKQQKISEVLEMLEGIYADKNPQKRLLVFIDALDGLLHLQTPTQKNLALMQYPEGSNPGSQKLIQAAIDSFYFAAINFNDEGLFSSDQIKNLNNLAEYAGLGKHYCNQYLKKPFIPDADTYLCIMEGYIKLNNLPKASKVIETMMNNHVAISQKFYTTLLQAYVNRDMKYTVNYECVQLKQMKKMLNVIQNNDCTGDYYEETMVQIFLLS